MIRPVKQLQHRFGLNPLKHSLGYWLALMLAIVLNGSQVKAQYCDPTGGISTYSSCAGGSILNVTFNTINHSAGCVSTPNVADYYKNLSGTVAPTSVIPGNSYFLSVTHSTTWAGGASVWIDFNGNQVFDAAERVLFSSTTSVGGVLSGNITIPASATGGTTRMRIVALEGGVPTNPCNPGGYSEVEDYSVVIGNKPYNNAGVTAFKPIAPFCAGPAVQKDIEVRVANGGANQINTVTVNWEVDGLQQTPFVFSSLIDTAGGVADTMLNIGSVLFNTSAGKTIRVWTSMPNNLTDTTNTDDTLTFVVRPQMSGTYTINTSGADFSSLDEAVTALQGGICGPVVLNYTGSNLTFNEQVEIPLIPGVSTTNNIVINGNGNTIAFDNSSSSARYILRLRGAKHVTINNLNLKSINTTYGWGIHFYQNADSNIVNGCTIDLSSVTSTTASNSVGIVFTNSTSSVTSASANGKGNLIQNNVLKGGSAAGMHYGICMVAQSTSSTPSYNKIINNTINDYYGYGIYLSNTNGTLVKGNTIANITKTANASTVYGISLISSSRLDSVIDNKISNPFGANLTSTGTFYGIHLTSSLANTPVGSENVVFNNSIFNVRGNGTFYGINCAPAPNTRIYHNTISFDLATTSTSSITYGFYATTGTGIQFLNNLINITRGGTGAKYLVYTTSSSLTTIPTLNNNAYFISTATNNNFGYYAGTARADIAAWRTITNQDANSVVDNPLFAYAPTGNLEPQSNNINDIGANLLTAVSFDSRGISRSATPDPGSFEYTPSGCLTPSNINITSITSGGATIGWTAPSPVPNSGYEYVISTTNTLPVSATNTSSTNSVIVSGLNSLTTYYVFVRSVCNSSPGTWAGPVTFTTLCAPLPGGTYTLGGPGADFANFTQLAERLNCGSGIAGQVIVNVTPNSAPFNEQVVFNFIAGASSTNNIVINGNGNTIQFSPASANRSIIRLQGTQYLTIDSLTIKSTNTTYGWGVHFYQSAMYNKITNCVIDLTSVTSSSAANSAGIVFSNSLTASTTAGANGTMNEIDGNIILGNPNGSGMYYGISLVPSTAASSFSGNMITNNVIRDFYFAGIYAAQTNGSIIKNNIIENPNKTSFASTVYGLTWNTAYRNDSIVGNVIRNLAGTTGSSTAAIWGIRLNNTTATANITPVGSETKIINNLIYGFVGNSSSTNYGIHSTNATNAWYYHNTINMDNATSSTNAQVGFYHTGISSGNGIDFRNNIISVTANTTGEKTAVYINNTNTGYQFNNNAYFVNGTLNEKFSFGGNALSSLQAWKATTGLDGASRFANPLFLSSTNITPNEGLVNGIGAALATPVVNDFNGVARGTNPDPGAIEFTTNITNDAGVYEIVLPTTLSMGSNPVNIKLFNGGASTLTNVQIEWEVNGVAQTGTVFNGSIETGQLSNNILLGTANLVSGAPNVIKAWTVLPNAMTDVRMTNDTATALDLYTALVAGNYTINANAPQAGNNFTSVDNFYQLAKSRGILGTVNVSVIDTLIQTPIVLSGVVPGASNTNKIIFSGVDTNTTIISTATSATITLNNTKHVTFRNLKVANTSTSGASAIWLTNSADSNSIINCAISLPFTTSGNSMFGVLASINATYRGAADNASGTLIDSCVITGGAEAVVFMGNTPVNNEPNAPGINEYNTISNSTIIGAYTTGIHAEIQSSFRARRNNILNIGNNVNTFPTGINLRENIVEGTIIDANTLTGMLGGQGIAALWDVGTNSKVTNNMIQMGAAANDVLAIRWIGNSADFVYNSVNVTSTNTNGTAFMISPNTGNTYNVYNNIFKNDNPGQVINLNTGTGVVMHVDNNCYYGTGAFPYRINNTNAATLNDFIALTNINNDSFTTTINPNFVSATNLRTFNPQLNNIGRPYAFVNTDIDGNLRSATTPDIGVNEFTLQNVNDAGVVGIVNPTLPIPSGTTIEVGVVIKNFGVGALTNANITYLSGSTSHTTQYTGSISEGATDTVYFTIANNMGLFIPLTGGFDITAYTSNPNLSADANTANDTFVRSYCQPLTGTYTINPNGVGANNFVTFTSAVDALKCGGISGNVIFNVATGTYNEQIEITKVFGADNTKWVKFQSVTGNKADVLLNYSSTNDTNNYVVRFIGANNIELSNISLSNAGTTYSRVIDFKMATGGVSNHFISIKNNSLQAPIAVTNNINTALIYAGAENHNNLTIFGNTLTGGSAGVFVLGYPTKLFYTPNLFVDSNQFVNNAYNGIVASNRENVSVKSNSIISNSVNMVNAISLSSTAGSINVSSNTIQIVKGNGIQLYQNAYYNELGVALVYSNQIHVNGTGSLAQRGVSVVEGSKVEIYNNTIKLESSNTTVSASGIHLEGGIMYSNLQNTASYGFKVINNIVEVENGYPLNVAELWWDPNNQVSRFAVQTINNNFYFNNNGTNVARVVVTDYAKTAFNSFKGAINANSDSISKYLRIPFATGTLKPLESDTLAWWVNGRALHIPTVDRDVTNANRATSAFNGVPDMGAHEITPTVAPPLATAIPALPVAGQTQSFIFMGDTIAKLTWDAFATPPSSVQVRQFVGERPPLVSANQKYMYWYLQVVMPTGYYNYNAELPYKDAWTGTMSANEADINAIGQDEYSNWGLIANSSVNTQNNIILAPNLYLSQMILTGTDFNNPLPVKLIKFTATKANNSVVLNWNTASEINASHFDVLRSYDGVTFTKIANVKANNAASSYNYYDNEANLSNSSTIYYKLISVDKNGEKAYSKVAVVKSGTDKNTVFSVYPNPVSNRLNVNIENNAVKEDVLVTIYNLNGEKISEQVFNSADQISIEVAGLSKGLYIVNVLSSSSNHSVRFVKD